MTQAALVVVSGWAVVATVGWWLAWDDARWWRAEVGEWRGMVKGWFDEERRGR